MFLLAAESCFSLLFFTVLLCIYPNLMIPCLLPTYFLCTYCLSFGIKTLRNVLYFLAHWSIYLCSFCFHLKNVPEYITGELPGCYFHCSSWLREVLLFLFWGIAFLSISLFNLLWWCPISIFPSSGNFLSLQVLLCFLDLVVLLVLLSFFSHFSLQHGTFFIPVNQLYIRIVCIRVTSSFSILSNILILYYITRCEFFRPEFAGHFSLEFEWP